MPKGNPELKKHVVGEFFENLSVSLFGGERQGGTNDELLGAPDIIHWENNQVYEIKATYRSDVHKIAAQQVSHYQELEQSEFPLDHPEVYYFMWNYKGKSEFAKMEHTQMERPLIKSEKSLMITSLDIIAAGINHWPTSCFPGGTPYHRVNSGFRRAFRKDHKQALADIGLQPGNYDFKRFKLEGRKYKRYNLPSFNITIVKNKKYEGVKIC